MRLIFGAILGSLLATALLLSSCATTSVSTVRNRAYSSIRFTRVLVSAPFSDLALRRDAEYQFVSELDDYGFEASAAIDLIPPVKQYSNEELAGILSENDIDGIMIVTLTHAYSDEVYIPETKQTRGSATIRGNRVYGQSRTQTYGGYSVSKPRVRFEVSLYSAASGDVVWRATTLTRGNAFAKTDTLLRSVADDVVGTYYSESKPR